MKRSRREMQHDHDRIDPELRAAFEAAAGFEWWLRGAHHAAFTAAVGESRRHWYTILRLEAG